MSGGGGSAERGLVDYLRILWRHKLLIALTVVVTSGAAVGLDHVRNRTYQGTAEVLFTTQGTSGVSSSSDLSPADVATDIELIQSAPVLKMRRSAMIADWVCSRSRSDGRLSKMPTLTTRLRGRLHEARIALPTKQGRRELRRRYVFEVLRSVVPVVGVETPAGLMFVSTRDRTVARYVYMSGAWDPDGLPDALDVAISHGYAGLAGRVFVEVGANIGTTTLQAARIASRCVVFEPEPRNLALLRANVAANELSDRVEVIAAAASATNGVDFLALSSVNDGGHRVANRGEIEIPTLRLDDALADRGVAPSDIGLLWMDTEGHEAQVLAGAPVLLASPPVTVLEYSPSLLRDRGDLDLLNSLIREKWHCVLDLHKRGSDPEDLDIIEARYSEAATDLLLLPE